MRCWISCCRALLQMSSGKTCWRGNGPAASLVGCLFLFCGWTGGLAGPLSCFSTWNWRKTLTKITNQPLCSKLFTPFLSLPSHQLCSMSSSLSCAMSLVPILITLKPFRPWTTTKCCFHLLPCFLIIPYHTISYWQRHITHAHLEMAQLLLACNCPPHLHT